MCGAKLKFNDDTLCGSYKISLQEPAFMAKDSPADLTGSLYLDGNY